MEEMRVKGAGEIYCPSCGVLVDKNVKFCPNCGKSPNVTGNNGLSVNQYDDSSINSADIREQREQRWLITLLLCIFLGGFGAHRFFAGKIGTAFLMIITLGGVGIWWLVDLITIAVGKFKDKQGNYITTYAVSNRGQ